MKNITTVKGYKVFEYDWKCKDKQYTCPGRFEEDVEPKVGKREMHFCKKASDCFSNRPFDSNCKVAEVVAYGTVDEVENKSCTNKLEIVREIPWKELLEIVNIGHSCTGINNTGHYNSGNSNSGGYNKGDYNSGEDNSGNDNSGDYNSGNMNSGNRNSGDCNSGNRNAGHWNSGHWNSGHLNSGNRNSGNQNSGNHNSGDWNSEDYNSGNFNQGDYNTGDWNKCNYSSGVFNTADFQTGMFNTPSKWTLKDWRESEACKLLVRIAYSESLLEISADQRNTW